MRKALILFVLLLIFPAAAFAEADDSPILVDHRTFYMCGDIFELSFPDIPGTSSMVSNTTQVHATAGPDERLLQVRVQVRNMTSSIIQGLTKESFKLTGYVRDRSITYSPELITFTDYYGFGNYYSWDGIPPLRLVDFLLVFRVKPVLINWELSIDTPALGINDFSTDNVIYTPGIGGEEMCHGLFQFSSVQTLETGVITLFER